MTDDLRTRIAAAIYNASDEYTRKLMVRHDCPGVSELEGDGKPICYALADAVIRELGLRDEWGALDADDDGVLADTREELTVGKGETIKHRYITEWSEE